MGADSGVESWLRAVPSAQPGSAPRAQPAVPVPRRARPALRAVPPPQRYRIRDEAGLRTLVCVEAPTVAVRIERGTCVKASEARHAAPGTIFLDGAAQGEPFADPVRAVYNLDHHEGCVRAFTLAACEQAMVLLLRGLDLRRREWTVIANDADLDAVLAIWVLLNHHRLAAPDGIARAGIMPLLRLEGAIDAHGLALQEFCALPPATLEETRRRMERLLDAERSLRANGRWQKADLLEYVQERLEQIDAFVYPQDAFSDLLEIEELGRASLPGGTVAVVCRAHVGIYEVERQLTRFHGPRLGLLVLRQREGVYTLRQTDPALPASLDALYAHLNRIDPAARPELADRRWGGSAEIGGSPRAGGTRLAPEAILDAFRHVYARPTRPRRLGHALFACAAALGAVLAAAGAGVASPIPDATAGAPAFACVLTLLALGCWSFGAQRGRGLFGGRLPQGLGWLASLPFALAGAMAGGAWQPVVAEGTHLGERLLLAALCGVGAEVLFRGFLHGRLTACSAPRVPGTGLAPAVLVSAAIYAAAGSALAAGGVLATSPIFAGAHPVLAWSGALLFGLAAGTARESSGSVLPPIALHALAVLALAAL